MRNHRNANWLISAGIDIDSNISIVQYASSHFPFCFVLKRPFLDSVFIPWSPLDFCVLKVLPTRRFCEVVFALPRLRDLSIRFSRKVAQFEAVLLNFSPIYFLFLIVAYFSSCGHFGPKHRFWQKLKCWPREINENSKIGTCLRFIIAILVV